MKTFSASEPLARLKRSSARNCLLINQFATPGLGSLMGGRIIAGTIQLLLAIGGFALVVWWMVDKFSAMAKELDMEGGSGATTQHPWLAGAGFGMFIASWILAWFTSISLVRNAPKTAPEPEERPIPPIIAPPKL